MFFPIKQGAPFGFQALGTWFGDLGVHGLPKSLGHGLSASPRPTNVFPLYLRGHRHLQVPFSLGVEVCNVARLKGEKTYKTKHQKCRSCVGVSCCFPKDFSCSITSLLAGYLG